MSFFVFVLLFLKNINLSLSCELNVGFITILTGNNAESGKQLQAAENIAIKEINNSTSLLPNCTINAIIIDSESSTEKVVKGALQLIGYTSDTISNNTQCNNNNNTDNNITHISVPFIMGAQLNILSSYLNAILTTFNVLQISGSSASTSLSQLSTFYRVVPSDSLQAEGLLQLCIAFNWTNIGILYINDAYGVYLHSIISTRASHIRNFQVTGASFDSDNYNSTNTAVMSLKDRGVWVIILIIHDSDFNTVGHCLKANGMTGYPYYYLGVDSWMHGSLAIKNSSLGFGLIGTLGTCPWSPTIDPNEIELYNSTKYEVLYAQVSSKHQTFMDEWNRIKDSNPELLYDMTAPGLFSSYGYDLMYLFAYTIHKYHETYGIPSSLDGYNITIIQSLLLEITFIGLTGNVSLNSFGDRYQGFFGICNLIDGDPNIRTVGYIIQTQNYPNLYDFHINNDNIIWPARFNEDTHPQPLTTPEIQYKTGHIIPGIFRVVCIVSAILTAISVVFGYLIIRWRNKAIIKSASWRLCLLLCFGCICGFATAVIYGIDERWIEDDKEKYEHTWRIMCNFRPCFFQMGLILGFGPLFAKTYRISKIFNMKVIKERIILDWKLFVIVFGVLFFDLFIFLIFFLTGGMERIYEQGELISSHDPLQKEYLQWGTCFYVNQKIGQPLFFTTGGVIGIMFIYGLYVSSTITKVKLRKFNEAIEIVITIIISTSLMIVVAPLVMFVPVTTQGATNLRYGALAASIIIAFSTTLFLIIGTRLWPIFRGKEKQFEKADLKNLQDIKKDMQQQLQTNLKKLEQRLFEYHGYENGIGRQSVVSENNHNTLKIVQHNKQLSSLVGASNVVSATNKFMITGKMTERCDMIEEGNELDTVHSTRGKIEMTSETNSTTNNNTNKNTKKNAVYKTGGDSSHTGTMTHDTVSNDDVISFVESQANKNDNNIEKRGTSFAGSTGVNNDKSPKSDKSADTDNELPYNVETP